MIIMKKEKNFGYVSPDVEIVTVACEQAIMSTSTPDIFGGTGADNEEFVDGGSFSDWK